MAIFVGKVKTSIYVDAELWERFKRYVGARGLDISGFLEETIEEALMEGELAKALYEIEGSEDYAIDFNPIEPKEGLVSELIGVMRNERTNSISGQQ